MFLLGRLGQTVVVLLVAAFVSFVMLRFVGDPVNNMVGQSATLAERETMRAALGLNDAVPLQFARFVGDALQGDLGRSYRFGLPVWTLLAERLPATLELSLCAMAISVVLGIGLGAWTALNRGRPLASALLAASLVGVALPSFLIGILLVLVFSVWLGWLPAFGRGEVVQIGRWSTGLLSVSGIKALILPSLTLGLFQMALVMRLVRAEMLEVMRSDYVRFARARGLSRRTVVFDHALRNTLVPVITIIGLQFGNVFAFSVVVETVFQWPGLGLLVIQAIQFADVPLLAAYLVLVALCFAIINLAVDLLYAWLDPRVRAGAAAAR
ncbi:ABC transporter permease [uncultured Enterovirga sp.]|uniref:ABC transporter permease n=1 Tax=uncultured Enterovirga sp. TaxID=2026352 RepID=UPI0035CB56B2